MASFRNTMQKYQKMKLFSSSHIFSCYPHLQALFFKSLLREKLPEVYLEPCQTSEIEFLPKTVNSSKQKPSSYMFYRDLNTPLISSPEGS